MTVSLIAKLLQMVVLVQNTGQPGSVFPFDIVIDPVDGLIYWSDSARNIISVLRFDGSEVGVIVNNTQQRPRALALAPENRSSVIFSSSHYGWALVPIS